MAIYSRSSIHNTYYRWFWIRKNKCIIKFNKQSAGKKCQYLINKQEKVGLNHFNDPKAFMEHSNDMQNVYKNIEDYNPIKKRKVLIIFDDMIADMINNNKLNPIVT